MRIHCCLLDRECRRYGRLYDAPLRLHIGTWSITLVSHDRRRDRHWRDGWENGTVYVRDESGVLRNVRGEASSFHAQASDRSRGMIDVDDREETR